jgi:hypothetical protein
MLAIIAESHLDHALTLPHLRFVLERFKDREAFFAETVELPADLPDLPCALRGPAVGLEPVPDHETILRARPGRTWPSRMMRMGFKLMAQRHVSWAPLHVRTLTVVAGPGLGMPCVLYTAYGGPLAPREPMDPSLPEHEREASERFWSQHALVL